MTKLSAFEMEKGQLQLGMSRRSLLMGLGSFAIAQGLSGCSSNAASRFWVELLRGSLPPQLVNEFGKQSANQSVRVKANSKAQLQDLFTLLQTIQQAPGEPAQGGSHAAWWDWIPLIGNPDRGAIPDLVTLGDYWLGKAIAQKLITPLDTSQFTSWKQLTALPQLRTLVTRNAQGLPEAQGQVWGIPYRLGTTVIAYRKDIFKQRQLNPPNDWDDLWRPEFAQRISLLNQAREVIGLTLKKLGKSFNTEDLSTVPNLEPALTALQKQVKFYSSTTYLQPLLLDDTWLAVGWSTDILPLAQRNQQIAVVVPKSGTALWADLWVHPAKGNLPLTPAASRWIDFCWQLEIAKQLSAATWAIAPALLANPPQPLPPVFQEQPALLPEPAILQASEFLLPLSEKSRQQYQALWEKLRQIPHSQS